MSMPSDAALRKAIVAFIDTADIATVSAKMVRKKMEAEFGLKLKSKKDFIKQESIVALQAKEQANESSSEDSDDEPIMVKKAKRKPETKKTVKRKAPVKKRTSTAMQAKSMYDPSQVIARLGPRRPTFQPFVYPTTCFFS